MTIVSQIESANRIPTIPTLHRIASVLGVSIDYLTGNTDKPEIGDLLQQEDMQQFFGVFSHLTKKTKGKSRIM